MNVDPMHQVVERHLEGRSYDRILDIGAWHIPYWRSTHIIDRLPWETRGGSLQLAPIPGERFSKETWYMLDITDASARFPFPDKYFDFVICGGTLEDLPDPRHCIEEIRRIGRAGYIRVPTTKCELTVGIEDRSNNVVGYCHHSWICDTPAPGKIVMMSKADAKLGLLPGRHIPLETFERNHRTEILNSIHFIWEGDFDVTFVNGPEVENRVQAQIRSLRIPLTDYAKDDLKRFARRTRDRLKGGGSFERAKLQWWNDMLSISEPYMREKLS